MMGKSQKSFEDNYGRVINFLSLFSKLSHFNLLDLPDLFMHHYFPLRFLMWQTWVCADRPHTGDVKSSHFL